jgi:hypothetical protein
MPKSNDFHKFTDIDRGIYGGVCFLADVKSIQVWESHTTIWTVNNEYFHVKELPHVILAEIDKVQRHRKETNPK